MKEKRLFKNRDKVAAAATFLLLIMVGLYQLIFEIQCISISDQLRLNYSVSVIVLFLFTFSVSYKDIKFNSYAKYFLAFLIVAEIQTYITDRTIFKETLIPSLVSLVMVLALIMPMKKADSYKQKVNIAFESTLILIITALDVACFKSFFLEHNTAGLLGHQNALGAYNAALCVLSVKKTLENDKYLNKCLFLFLAVFSFLVIVKTTSRSSMIAVVASLGIIFAYLFICKFGFKKATAFALIAFIAVMALFGKKILPWVLKGWNGTGSIFESVLHGRYGLWFIAFPRIMKGHWLFGQGIYTISKRAGDILYYSAEDGGMVFSLFHNMILDLIYTAGIFGIVLLVFFVIYLGRHLTKKDLFGNIANVCSLAIVVGFLLANLFDVYFIWDTATYNWLLLFLELSILINSKEKGGVR